MSKARGPTYIVKFRRRRTHITDYRKRLNMLKSKLPRLVVRRSNKNIICQIIEFDSKGDKTVFSAHTRELKAFGWLPKVNTPTAYLVGLLLAKKTKSKINKVILDIGRYTASKNNIAFSVAKALIDSGIECPMNQEMIDSARISGTHISNYAKSLDGEKFKNLFGDYLANNIDPRNLPDLFESVKEKIMKG